MSDVSIEVRGLAEVQRKLAGAPKLLQDGLTQAIDKSLKILQRDVAKYPPKPPLSKYRRTNTLKRGWTTRVSGTYGVLGNATPYAPYVQDEPRQAWFHKAHGWQTIQTVAKNNTPRIVKIIEDAVNKILQGN